MLDHDKRQLHFPGMGHSSQGHVGKGEDLVLYL